MRSVRISALGAALSLGLAADAAAQQLSVDVEAVAVSGVGDSWTPVSFLNSYTQAVPVCTYRLPSTADPSTIVRIRNVTATGMEVRAQIWEPSGSVAPSDVWCLVVDAGVRSLPGGQTLEARRILSTGTTGLTTSNWNIADYENVGASFTQTFPNLIVLGQVMTYNDPDNSAFHTRGSSRGNRPTSGAFNVSKHIGQISGSRANETLAVIATSPGSGTANDVFYQFGITPNVIEGVRQGGGSASVLADFDLGVLTQNAENGGQGGFASFLGGDPLPSGQLTAAIDEETFAGDTLRGHVAEEVAFALFRDDQAVAFSNSKTVDIAGGASGFSIPGEEHSYTITVAQTGSAPLEERGVFIVDPIPAEVSLWTGDLGAPGSGPVAFADSSSGLTFDPATDIGYSSSATPPADFAACSSPANGAYDASIRYLCLRPGGRLRPGTLYPGASAAFTFRVRID